MSSLVIVARARPTFLGQVVQALELLHGGWWGEVARPGIRSSEAWYPGVTSPGMHATSALLLCSFVHNSCHDEVALVREDQLQLMKVLLLMCHMGDVPIIVPRFVLCNVPRNILYNVSSHVPRFVLCNVPRNILYTYCP